MGKIQEQVNNDLKQAILNKDEKTKSILRVLIGEFGRGKNKELSDDETIKFIKTVADGLIMCGNNDELAIISKYLPKILGKGELTFKIDEIIAKQAIDLTSKKSIGIIIGFLKAEIGSAYDGKVVSDIINSRLQ